MHFALCKEWQRVRRFSRRGGMKESEGPSWGAKKAYRTPGSLHEYQKEGDGERGVCMSMKTMEIAAGANRSGERGVRMSIKTRGIGTGGQCGKGGLGRVEHKEG